MGGNGSYSKEFGGVPEASRTHIETEYRIDGHKVLLFGENVEHDKIILNANSDSPTYLFGKKYPQGLLEERVMISPTISLLIRSWIRSLLRSWILIKKVRYGKKTQIRKQNYCSQGFL